MRMQQMISRRRAGVAAAGVVVMGLLAAVSLAQVEPRFSACLEYRPADPVGGDLVQFDVSACDAVTVEWEWDFGDGSPIEIRGATAAHAYAAGTYRASATTRGCASPGCSASVEVVAGAVEPPDPPDEPDEPTSGDSCEGAYHELLVANQQALDAWCKTSGVNCPSGVRCDSCCPTPPACDECCEPCEVCPEPCASWAWPATASLPGVREGDPAVIPVVGLADGPGWASWTCAPPQSLVFTNPPAGGYAEMTCRVIDGRAVNGSFWAFCESATTSGVRVTVRVGEGDGCKFDFASVEGAVFGVQRIVACGGSPASARKVRRMLAACREAGECG